MGTVTGILITEMFLIFGFHSGEIFVQSRIKIFPGTFSESYAEHRQDVRCSGIFCPVNDCLDIFFCVVDKGEYRHQCYTGVDAFMG